MSRTDDQPNDAWLRDRSDESHLSSVVFAMTVLEVDANDSSMVLIIGLNGTSLYFGRVDLEP